MSISALLNLEAWQTAGWVASFCFVVGGVNATLKLADRLRGQPPSEPLKLMAAELNKRLENLERSREKDFREQEERRRAIYAHVDKTRLELKADLKALDAKMAVMPAEIVALLRNAGAIP